MPYVPSLKTDGKSDDRIVLDEAVEKVAKWLVWCNTKNGDVALHYKLFFSDLRRSLLGAATTSVAVERFANSILEVGAKYGYEGAFLGEMNYSITRLIQRVPQLLAEQGKCGLEKGKELRYWLYAMTVGALNAAATECQNKIGENPLNIGLGGVFNDIVDEYKVRVNASYEIEQIRKSGDCYDTPYFNKIVEVTDEQGKNIGYFYVNVKNDGKNKDLDELPFKLVAISKEIKKQKKVRSKKPIVE